MAETYQSLSTATQNGVLTLTLLGPGKGNAMGSDFWAELPQIIDEINRMDDVRAVILRGSGDHFSYGLDLPDMMPKLAAMVGGNQMADRRRELMDMIRQMQSGFLKIHESPKPFIAAVHGWCIGGGLNMISAADIRLCSATAKFSLREAKLAITPDIGGLQWLPRIVGEGITREMAFTAGDYDANFALRTGLVNHILDTPDELFAKAEEMAHQIADNAHLAVQGAKAVLNYGLDKSIDAGLQYVAVWNSSQLESIDFSEAMEATAERRQAAFNKKINRGY
ncbi:crotonase/enoyl-CoA hydratase family protein [Fibrella aquatica]|jgi:enoyl-CoA hydratase|uniref:crotonase/enoyl-CoA hydratase family protein n=1 Tax=Fibrella aquatica TaxID=3242487 RepID=UPI0035207DA4